ncbi:hypothetical protein BJ546DRAFT_834228 [Cryomyces antarcticus]
MASRTPTLDALQKPEPLKDILKREQAEYDCVPCRVMGASAFIGLGAYSYLSGQHQLRQRQAEILRSGTKISMKSRQMGITSISLVLVGMGLYRLVN